MHRFLSHTTAAVLALTIPFTAIATGVLDAQDSIAGLGIDVSVSGAKSAANIPVNVTNPDGRRSSITIKTDAAGDGIATVPGESTQTAGTYSFGAAGMNDATANVAPDTMDPWTSVVESWTGHIAANGYDEAEVSVTLRDRHGNPLPGRPVALISNRSDDMVTALTPQTDDEGTQHFTVSTETDGTIQLRAVDLLSGNTLIESADIRAGLGMGGQDAYAAPATNAYAADVTGGRRFYFNAQVTTPGFDVLQRFEVTAPATLNPGEEAVKITVRAVDRNGNTVEDYDGTVRFVTTDPNATVPNFGTYTFRERDLGEKIFPLALKFQAIGEQTLRVEDMSDTRIFGETTIDVGGNGGGGGGAGGIDITSHQNDDHVNALTITIEGRGPRYANLIVMGGDMDYTGSTDAGGAFSIPINLNPGRLDHTIRVRDDVGAADSGPVHLILDRTTPTISSVVFTPEQPEEGDKVLVIVESEPDLAQAALRIADRVNGAIEEIKLLPMPTASGSYQGFFTAPAPDVYQPTAVVMDAAGNVEELRTQLTVGGKGLPVVEGLEAQPQVDAVELSWAPVTGDVSGYRIHIGDEEGDWLYTLDTGRVITKATVKGLTPGKEYVFAVTALRGDAESSAKSISVKAQVLGFSLEIAAEAGALHVTWTSLTTDLPLSSFVLEYGTDENRLTESRMINGDLRDFTIRDLLPGIQYFVSITPVSVTGDKLDELSAVGGGTPAGDGFMPGARDDVPFDVGSSSGGEIVHSGAPNIPSTGIPAVAWMSAVALGTAGVLWRMHRRNSIRKTDAFLRALQTRHGKF